MAHASQHTLTIPARGRNAAAFLPAALEMSPARKIGAEFLPTRRQGIANGVVPLMRLRGHKGEDAVAFLLAGIETSPVSRDRRLRNALSLWSGSGWAHSHAKTSSGRLAGCCVGRHAVIRQIARGRKRSTRNFAAISASCRLRAASASRGRGPGDGTPFSPDELAARMWQYHAGSIGGPRS